MPISGDYHVVITSFTTVEPVCNDGLQMVHSSGEDWGNPPTFHAMKLTEETIVQGIVWLRGEWDAYATWKESNREIIDKDDILLVEMKEYLNALGDSIPNS